MLVQVSPICVRRLVWHREEEEDPDKEILEISYSPYGTGKKQDPDKEILKIVKEKNNFRPGMITDKLDLEA